MLNDFKHTDSKSSVMNCPPPPCCKISVLKKTFERNTCCIKTGGVGLKIFDKHRSFIMIFAAALSSIAAILSIVSIVSVSANNENVRTTSWSYGSVDGGGEVFVGLRKFVFDSKSGNSVTAEWSASDCEDIEGATPHDDFCESCKSACDNSIGTAATNLVTAIPAIVTDLYRSTRKGDLNCHKSMAIVLGFISLFTSIVSLASYSNGCYPNLPETFFGRDVSYEVGPGFVCLLAACMLKPVDILINILMPVCPHDDDLNEKLVFENNAVDFYDLNIG